MHIERKGKVKVMGEVNTDQTYWLVPESMEDPIVQ